MLKEYEPVAVGGEKLKYNPKGSSGFPWSKSLFCLPMRIGTDESERTKQKDQMKNECTLSRFFEKHEEASLGNKILLCF